MIDEPDLGAQIDQMKRGLVDLAGIVRAYYGALLDAGFSVEQAFALTIVYQQSFCGSKS